ncbi:MAG: diguanylate cyclase [Lysobacteraceae bacterium]
MAGRALALALLLAATGAVAATVPRTPGPPVAVRDAPVAAPDIEGLDALEALRVRNPAAFVARLAALRDSLPPTTRAARDRFRLLQAHAEHLQGRSAAGIAIADRLADEAEDPGLRFTARALVVNLLSFTRDFERMLRMLGPMLDDAREGRLDRDQRIRLFVVAATLYAELGRPDLSTAVAREALALDPPLHWGCAAETPLFDSLNTGRDPSLTDADIHRAIARCRDAGDAYGPALLVITKARFLARTATPAEALAVLDADADAREATGYRWLIAEGSALRATLLLALDRDAEAEAEARRAVGLSNDLPSGRPMATAHEVLYRVALRRGDTQAALQHLEAQMAALRPVYDEARAKEQAVLVVQHEARQREQALALAASREQALARDEAVAAAERRNATIVTMLAGLALLGAVGWSARVMVQERRYRRLARTDGLTGFANRAGFVEAAAATLRRSVAAKQPIALIVFDLDHFKDINDTHGHLAGDAVLRAVAGALRELPPVERLVGRIGGEEFAILLPGATPAQARGYAEACRLAIAATSVVHEDTVLRVTASFGIARADLVPEPLPTLLARSDRALYRAKHSGRDRIVEHEELETVAG